MIRSRQLRLIPLAFSLLLAGSAEAQIQRTISFQGTLADAGGDPLDGEVPVTFRLYDIPSNGSAVWSESQTVVAVKGVFNTQLGETTPLPDPYLGTYRWLGIEVDGGGEGTPRLELTAVPFALTSEHAATSDQAVAADTADFARRTAPGWTPVSETLGLVAFSSEFETPPETAFDIPSSIPRTASEILLDVYYYLGAEFSSGCDEDTSSESVARFCSIAIPVSTQYRGVPFGISPAYVGGGGAEGSRGRRGGSLSIWVPFDPGSSVTVGTPRLVEAGGSSLDPVRGYVRVGIIGYR